MALIEGTRVGPYEIAEQIGAGGMGEVYRATDTNRKRAVAIKVLPSAVGGDAERLARFQREAEVLATLNHPNIAAIYGLERSEGWIALVMELVEGPTLADRIAAGPIPLDEALPIARQIAEALEAAHEHGIIHRDLKPANIKVRSDGAVKVLDFGLAKAMDPATSHVPGVSQAPTVTTPALMTGMGVILGTAAYMSPEQAKGQAADRRSDIWSFGCVLFEMLTGKRTFGGEDVIDTIAEVRRAEPDWAALPGGNAGVGSPAAAALPGQGPQGAAGRRVHPSPRHRRRGGWPAGAMSVGDLTVPSRTPGLERRRGGAVRSRHPRRARGVYVGWIDFSQPPRRFLEGLESSAVYAMSGHLLFPRDGALMVQRFDVTTLTFSGEPRQLVENIRMDVTQGLTHVSVSETGALVYRRALGEGETQRRLVWLDREGREIRQLDAREPANSNQLALSPDGQRLVVGNPSGGLWMMETERGTRTRFTFDTNDGFPLWSRDGNVLVYTSLRDGVRNLYHRSLAGGDAERLLATPGSKAAHDWSPDGRLLLYRDFDQKTRSDLWVIPVEPAGQPGRVRVPTDGRAAHVVQTPAQELNGQFSPDGEWIADDSDESDCRQVYIVPFRRQGTKQLVSIDGGSQPRWRADGAELFFVSSNGQLMAAPIRRGADRSMAPGSPVSLVPVSLRVGVLNTPYEYEVSRDGKQFLVNLVTDSRSITGAIVNWAP